MTTKYMYTVEAPNRQWYFSWLSALSCRKLPTYLLLCRGVAKFPTKYYRHNTKLVYQPAPFNKNRGMTVWKPEITVLVLVGAHSLTTQINWQKIKTTVLRTIRSSVPISRNPRELRIALEEEWKNSAPSMAAITGVANSN